MEIFCIGNSFLQSWWCVIHLYGSYFKFLVPLQSALNYPSQKGVSGGSKRDWQAISNKVNLALRWIAQGSEKRIPCRLLDYRNVNCFFKLLRKRCIWMSTFTSNSKKATEPHCRPPVPGEGRFKLCLLLVFPVPFTSVSLNDIFTARFIEISIFVILYRRCSFSSLTRPVPLRAWPLLASMLLFLSL